MTIEEIKSRVISNKDNHDSGYYNCIPFDLFPRFEKYVPGIVPGRSYSLTGSSGCGKSKLARTLFIHQPLKYVLDHPDLGIDLAVLYFSLEEDTERVHMSELSRILRSKYGVSVSIDQLLSIGKANTVPRELFPMIDDCQADLELFKSRVTVIDNITNPTGVYKAFRDKAYDYGRYISKTGEMFSAEDMRKIKEAKRGENSEDGLHTTIDRFQFLNPRTYIIVLFDHISLTSPEKEDGFKLSLHQSMSKLSNYMLEGKNRLHIIPVAVHQQAQDKESMEYTARGTTIEEKLEPSLDGLGDNKIIQRDFEVILGVFQPARYNIKKHLGFDITKIGDNYRALSILKDRNNAANRKLPLYFDGASDHFEELPIIKSEAEAMALYKKIEKLNAARL